MASEHERPAQEIKAPFDGRTYEVIETAPHQYDIHDHGAKVGSFTWDGKEPPETEPRIQALKAIADEFVNVFLAGAQALECAEMSKQVAKLPTWRTRRVL